MATDAERRVFDRYLSLLGVKRSEPDFQSLAFITSAHLKRMPFENVSKIHRVRIRGVRQLPDLEEYLDNAERHNFGGTCFTNNYHLHLLLRHLGYDVRLCGADIAVNGAPPDGHMLNVVTIDGREVIVDVGYGAPFWQPIPRDESVDQIIGLGSDRYVFKPRDGDGRSRLEVYHNDELVHGYLMKPAIRKFGDFADVIARSYQDTAPFLNRLMVARFFDNHALVLRNNRLSELTVSGAVTRELGTKNEIATLLAGSFGLPASTARDVLDCLGDRIFQ